MKIWIPKFNFYSKKLSLWQDRDFRRLRLLNYVGFNFWNPQDFAMQAYYGHGSVEDLYSEALKTQREQMTQQMTSAGCWSVTNAAAAAGGDVGTLTLNTLSSVDTDDIFAQAYIEFRRNGNVYERTIAQNPTVEYTDNTDPTVGDFCEAKLDTTSGSAPTFSGGTWAENTYNQIDENLRATHERNITGSSSGSGTAYVREIADTGNLVTASFTITATITPGGCPLCCFTPETLITMANGSAKPIISVEVGDEILTDRGPEKVTGLIVREQRDMYDIRFDGAGVLSASDDHPIYVVDKGYASINPDPNISYKDLGVPEKLEIGDTVVKANGDTSKITSIRKIHYPYKVYTFENSRFYANGVLVY